MFVRIIQLNTYRRVVQAKVRTLTSNMVANVNNVIYHIDTEFRTALEAICMFDKAESSEFFYPADRSDK